MAELLTEKSTSNGLVFSKSGIWVWSTKIYWGREFEVFRGFGGCCQLSIGFQLEPLRTVWFSVKALYGCVAKCVDANAIYLVLKWRIWAILQHAKKTSLKFHKFFARTTKIVFLWFSAKKFHTKVLECEACSWNYNTFFNKRTMHASAEILVRLLSVSWWHLENICANPAFSALSACKPTKKHNR